jgi:hypothetical protein
LAAKGLEPIVYDNLSRGYRWAARYGPLELAWKPARSELALEILDAWNWMTKKMTALSDT